jgi:hypothetical protein
LTEARPHLLKTTTVEQLRATYDAKFQAENGPGSLVARSPCQPTYRTRARSVRRAFQR